jgi:drug/metabolite transporter (DMT)-like permease
VLLAALRRLAWPRRMDMPVILSVGTLQIACFFGLANLGVQDLPAGRSGVLAYTTMLWVVPLSILMGEKVRGRAMAGVGLGVLGVGVLVEPMGFDWNDRAVLWGHAWLLLAGLSWAIAIVHTRRHSWGGTTPLDVLPWQMSLGAALLWLLAILVEPSGYLDIEQSRLWLALLYVGVVAGPTATWAAVSVARSLPPVISSLGMLGVPLLSIASATVLLDEPITLSLALGTALVIAGIAVVVIDGASTAPS